MGHWGTDLLAGDAAVDAYEAFLEAYDKGGDPSEIRRVIAEEARATSSSSLELAAFLAGLSNAQWKCGVLSAEDLEHLKEAIGGIDDFLDPAEERSLKVSSARLIAKLSAPTKLTRKRKIEKLPSGASLEPGDCVAVCVGDFFGAAMVTRILVSRGKRWHRMVPLNYLEPHPPSRPDFDRRNWIIEDLSKERRRAAQDMWGGMKAEDWLDRPSHAWVTGADLKRSRAHWSVVCNLPIRPDDPVRSTPMDESGETAQERWIGETFGSWSGLLGLVCSSMKHSIPVGG